MLKNIVLKSNAFVKEEKEIIEEKSSALKQGRGGLIGNQ
jgi:hypothetical protein